ncbi:MAG: cache domain-containing protein [Gemmatimonadales bacterium]|nr:cache domain-containing protein [Gemmatimonadales bacterium]
MKAPKTLSTSIFRNMAVILGAVCLGLGVAWIAGDIDHRTEDMGAAENAFIEGRKAEVRALVCQLVDDVEYQIETAEQTLQSSLKERVNQAVALAYHMNDLNGKKLTREERVVLVREAVRSLHLDDDSGCYFILDLQGRVILHTDHTDHTDAEGMDLRSVQDPAGHFVILEMLELVAEKGEGSYSYLWTKPGVEGNDHRKTSFIRLFEPLGLIIGTGQYFEDFIAREQAVILRRLEEVTFGEGRYVFVNTYDGTALVIRSDKYKPGDNLWELTDAKGLKIMQEERRAVSNPEGDFIFYSWLEPGSTEHERKISFLKGIERWQWMIGSGVHLDELESATARQREAGRWVIIRVVAQIFLAFFCAFLAALFMTRRLSRKIQGELGTVGALFNDAVSHNRQIDTPSLDYTEFRGFADSMNEMIVERRKIEQELLNARNLESIGVLAGGIAHDFNNLLTAILGNISLAMEDVPLGGPAHEALEKAENASERARGLTGQLLAFAKGGSPVLSLENLGALIRESAEFSLRGSNVQLELDIPQDLWPAEVDTGQFSQIVGNLVVNADQAMPTGGILNVSAMNAELEAMEGSSLPGGNYLAIEFADNGQGISSENLTRIFDPYFTTKSDGNGLGLASVYAIIKNHQGEIKVDSPPGSGTVVKILIPARRGEQTSAKIPEEGPEAFNARVLVMDDDPDVSKVCGLMLERLGCEVEFARDGEETLASYDRERAVGRGFDLVILDLTIRDGMGGQETIAHLLDRNPEAVAAVSSGYFNDPVMAQYRDYGFKGMIRKPYNMKELRLALGQVLKG